MGDNDQLLISQLSRAADDSFGLLSVRSTSTAQLGKDLGYRLPLSRNPVIRLVTKTGDVSREHLAYTLIVDGRRRVASRVESLGGALATIGVGFFSRYPLLLIFDYVERRALAVSCAALFGRFLEETKVREIPPSNSATFSLTPSFDNLTVSMYAMVTAPSVWAVSFDDATSAATQLIDGLERVRKDTELTRSQHDEIVSAVQSRVSAEPQARGAGDSVAQPRTRSMPSLVWREELDATGQGSGVEADDDSGLDATVHEPFDPDEIEVQTRQITIDLLLSRLRHKAIDLDPEFQRRRGIWTDQRQSRLIESILLKIPLPTFYAAEDKDENWIVVDGIQRLTAIARFASPEAIGDSPLRLSGLEYLGDSFDKVAFADLDTRLRRRLLETELVLHVIRYGTPDAVKDNIFARINTGGVPLSRQELRHALIPGPARTLLREWAATNEFQRATSGSVSPQRMNDRELVLRFATFSLFPPYEYASRDFDRFLGDGMRRLNTLDPVSLAQLEKRFKQSLNLSYLVFGDNAFRKSYAQSKARFPVNKALFEVITVVFSGLDDGDSDLITERREAVVSRFLDLLLDRDFDSAISQGTGDVRKVHTRFGMFQQTIRGILS